MSKRTKFKLLILAAALCITAVFFAGCSGELDVKDFLEQQDAYNQQVTYYSNGGYFDGTNNSEEKNIYYRAGDEVLTDFDSVHGKSISRSNYVFAGWYYVELDAENKPVIETVTLDGVEKKVAKIDESKPLKKGLKIPENTHLYVGAKWEKDIQLRYKLKCESPIKIMENGVETVKNDGDIIYLKDFFSGSAAIGDKAPVKSTDSTFLQYYLDEACTIPAKNSFVKPTGDDAQEKATVYAKYIPGIWTVVKTKVDVLKMFNNLDTETSYYIFDDINCSGLTFGCKSGTDEVTANCYIEGNGKTISNMRFDNSPSSIAPNGTYSVFGVFGDKAAIKNLTLDGVTVTYTSNKTVSGFYFFDSGDNGATFENFNIKNVEMVVESSGIIFNIQKPEGGTYNDGNWLFGSVSSDDAYGKTGEGKLVINGKKLTVNGEEVVNQPIETSGGNL